MEISDELEIEILITLQKIRLVEDMVRRNVKASSEDIIVQQHQSLKVELYHQISVLLSIAINAKVQIGH